MPKRHEQFQYTNADLSLHMYKILPALLDSDPNAILQGTPSVISLQWPAWLCFRSSFKFFYRVWKIGQFSDLVFGPKWASYERSRSINRCILREISARTFLQFPKMPQMSKNPNFGEKINFGFFGKNAKKKLIFLAIQSPAGHCPTAWRCPEV